MRREVVNGVMCTQSTGHTAPRETAFARNGHAVPCPDCQGHRGSGGWTVPMISKGCGHGGVDARTVQADRFADGRPWEPFRMD
jgi:hypothetical protein